MRPDLIDDIQQEMHENAPANTSLLDQVLSYIIPQGTEVPKPDSVFELSGIPVLTKKSISTLSGKAKSGKTTVTAWVVAQCIMQGLTVLWLDTEQGQYYGSRTQSWILNIAGLNSCPTLHYLDVRVFMPTERFQMLEEAVKYFNPDLVIIDGIRDLVFDINSPEEATIRSNDIMKICEQHDCHVLNVIHTNKGNDLERGHLGTEMSNKAETVISVTQDESKNVVCSAKRTRGEPFQDFAFTRDNYGIPQLIQDYMGHVEVGVGKRSIHATDYTIDEHRFMLKLVFINDEKLAYSDFVNGVIAGYQTHGISIGIAKAKAFIEHFKQQNIVHVEKEWKHTYYSLINRFTDV